MTTTVKPIKDKPPPRLTPRPTAASAARAARAARNATNRNLSMEIPQKCSPNRSSNPTSFAKVEKGGGRHVRSGAIVVIEEIIEERVESALQSSSAEQTETILGRDLINPETTAQNTSKSLTSTPKTVTSRPGTPQHPRMPPSRPVTPAFHARQGNPVSRPITPQPPTESPRPKTPTNTNHNNRISSPIHTAKTPQTDKFEDRNLRSEYESKQQEFSNLKKELDLKQQAVLELYECLRKMNEEMVQEGVSAGGEAMSIQDLVMFNVRDWPTEELVQLCREMRGLNTESAVEFIKSTNPLDGNLIEELDTKVIEVPNLFAELCLQAFNTRQELIDWIKDLLKNEEGAGDLCLDRIAYYNNQGLELCDALRNMKNRADDALGTISQLSKRMYRERSVMLAVGESLVREVARLRLDLETTTTALEELKSMPRNDKEAPKALEDARRELEEERAIRNAMTQKLSTTEQQLRQARSRINKMERQLREAETSITSLTGTVKSLEDQSRQREVQLEARARKLKESVKTGEIASNHLTQQREALQAEVLELKERIEKLNTDHRETVQNLNNKIKELNMNMEDIERKYKEEAKLKEQTETSLLRTQSSLQELQNKIQQLEATRPNPELPTEREMDIWAELQATKETLHMTEEELNSCKCEKVRFLETFTKIAENENKVGMQQKLAAELLNKEEVMSKMQQQIREMTKCTKLNEQKVIQYEQFVHDLQAHIRTIANCPDAANGINYQELQQEVMNLRMNLLEAVHRNEELSEMLVQKEQQLDQQDKTSRAQARIIKVHEGLINMLKNKETEQGQELLTLQKDLEHRMKIVDDVNKQIASKAEEIQELFTTLENKQQQIHRLEKIVLALEEQQRRAQAQRTRHEEKIAALEHELAGGTNKNQRKFIFF